MSHRSPTQLTAGPETQGMGGSAAFVSLALRELDPQVDLAHVEADRLDIEVEFDARELLQLLGQQPVIPGSDLRQPIVGDHEGPLLRLGEMLKANGRDLAPSQTACRLQAPVARNHFAIGADEDRDVEPERLDAVGDLTDLLWAMLARVAGIRLQALNRHIFDRQRQPPRRARC